jgi:hypothetical protein
MKTQAMGWLAAAVVAAGLNANYHQGGMPWAHRIADRVTHNTEAVVALATGHADRFLAEAQLAKAQDKTSCPFHTVMARMRSRLAHSQARFDSFDDRIEAREQAQAAHIAARRERLQAQITRIRIPAVAMPPVVVAIPKIDVCRRIHVNVPQIPRIKAPAAPVIHIDLPDPGTV